VGSANRRSTSAAKSPFGSSPSPAALNQLMLSFAAWHGDDPRTLLLIAPGCVKTELGGPSTRLNIDEYMPRHGRGLEKRPQKPHTFDRNQRESMGIGEISRRFMKKPGAEHYWALMGRLWTIGTRARWSQVQILSSLKGQPI
jgi:hypothetical protein